MKKIQIYILLVFSCLLGTIASVSASSDKSQERA